MSGAIHAANTTFAVMSYERGEYLANCVRSITRHFPGAQVIVYDDGSADRRTRKVLAALGHAHEICLNSGKGERGEMGGLYFGMNRALDRALADGKEYLYFLQDDQQVVRPLDAEFLGQTASIFAADERIVEVSVLFFKGIQGAAYFGKRCPFDARLGCYVDQAANGTSDTGIFHVERLRRAGFRFLGSEQQTAQSAHGMGIRLGLHPYPVMMYTPWPRPARRRKMRHPGIRWIREAWFRTGMHPYLEMDGDALRRLRDRPAAEHPLAEDYLRTRAGLLRPWWFTLMPDEEGMDQGFVARLAHAFRPPGEYLDWLRKLG